MSKGLQFGGGWNSSWGGLKTKSNGSSRGSKLERSSRAKSERASEIKERVKNYSGGGFILRFICYRTRRIDLSNLCVKWIEDALVTFGLIPDDSFQIVKRIECPGIEQEA
jgi:hypothetical protein